MAAQVRIVLPQFVAVIFGLLFNRDVRLPRDEVQAVVALGQLRSKLLRFGKEESGINAGYCNRIEIEFFNRFVAHVDQCATFHAERA